MAELRLRQTTILFLLAICVLAGVCALSVWSTLENQSNNQSVNHYQKILLATDQLSISTNEVQASSRGYVIAPSRLFLSKFENAVKQTYSDFNVLESLIVEPQRVKRISELKQLVENRIAWSRKIMASRDRDGMKEAAALVAQGTGTNIMEQIRTAIGEVQSAVRSDHEASSERVSHYSRLSLWTMAVGGFFSLFVASFVVVLLSRETTLLRTLQRSAESARQEADRARKVAERAKSAAENANAAKSQFLSRISHELRTPMNAILGFAQLLEMDALEERQREAVKHILGGGRHLLNLINDVLDISRIEAGEISLSMEATPIKDLVSEAVQLVQPIADRNGITLRNETAGSELHVRADRQRLRQVLMNLLSNAVKYNVENGSVTITCRPESGRNFIEVKDTGKGVPAEKAELLFAPFERLGADAQLVEGTGLGLSLSRRLTEAMGGKISFSPNPDGNGSTFTVELGDAPEPTLQIVASDSKHMGYANSKEGGRTVLYIEDNVANFKLVEQLLQTRQNLRLITAMQGRLGLELAIEHKPDLILLDLHLPDADGSSILTELKLRRELQNVPVIIVSADATERQIKKLMSLGAYAYVTKPFQLAELISKVDLALAEPTT